MAQALKIDIVVDQNDIDKLGKEARRGVETAALVMTERLLDKVEEATLVRKYTQNSNPSKPPGSTYIRKFILQSSSSKAITKSNLPIEGTWIARARYASFVVGEADQQAAIHKGRWPALEVALTAVVSNAQPIFDDEFKKVAK